MFLNCNENVKLNSCKLKKMLLNSNIKSAAKLRVAKKFRWLTRPYEDNIY